MIITQVVLVQSLLSALIILSHCLTVWISLLLFVVEILTLLLRDRMAKQNVLIASLREIIYVFLGTIQFPKK